MDFSLRKFLEISACFHWVSIGNSTLLTTLIVRRIFSCALQPFEFGALVRKVPV